jgi:hypothetical protein
MKSDPGATIDLFTLLFCVICNNLCQIKKTLIVLLARVIQKGFVVKNYTKLLLTICLLQAGVAFAQEKPEPQLPRFFSNIVSKAEEAWDKAPNWFVATSAGVVGGSFFGKAGMIGVRVRAASAGAVIAMGVAKLMESQRNPLEARVTDLEKASVRKGELVTWREDSSEGVISEGDTTALEEDVVEIEGEQNEQK